MRSYNAIVSMNSSCIFGCVLGLKMPACKFFLQGSCRYGERCWNEHPRGGERRGRQQYDDRRQNSWGNENREQYPRQQHYGEGGHHQNRNRQQQQHYQGDNSNSRQQSYQVDDSNSRQQNYYEDRGSRRNNNKSIDNPNKDFEKYHWNRENKFAALQEEPKSETNPDIIISTIQKDMKLWNESKMWPYSCYSYTRGTRCIEGLADISPEEIRVLAHLHQSQYSTIIEEINRTYIRTKEELFEMSQSMKSDVLSNLNGMIESNPSSDLKIVEFYGPQYNFESDKKAEPLQQPQGQSFSFNLEQNKGTTATIPSASFDTNAGGFSLAAVQKPTNSPAAKNISVFGVKMTEKKLPLNSGKDSGVYTPHDLLTETEKTQFEADRFIAGQIPTRPPSELFCQ